MTKPIIPWIGGKRRLARHILPLFPAHTCYVEPFCGAAALFFSKPPAKAEVLNDINGELVNLYRVVQHHLEEFLRQFKWALTSRQIFKWLQATPPRLNLLRLEEDLSDAHLRLAGATIEHLDWAECIRRYDRPATLFYCDPPYWGTTGYGVGFELAQYDRLAELARSIQGKMVISVNDIPEMRQAFGGLAMERVEITYAVGGKGRPAGRSGELVIRSW